MQKNVDKNERITDDWCLCELFFSQSVEIQGITSRYLNLSNKFIHHQSLFDLCWAPVCSCPCHQGFRHYRRRNHKHLLSHLCHGRPGWRWECRDSYPGCSGGRPHQCPDCCRTHPRLGHYLSQTVKTYK